MPSRSSSDTPRPPPRPTLFPYTTLFRSGVPVALGADDPLLFGRRLVRQYEIARDVHGFAPAELAELARMSVRASASSAGDRKSTRLNSSHSSISYAVFCLKKKNNPASPP